MVERAGVAVVLGLGLAGPILAAAGAVASIAPASRGLTWAIGGLLAVGALGASWRSRDRFPAALNGAARRHPMRAAIWILLALVALLQLGRLCAFMANPANTFGSAFPDPGLTRHMCMSAYVQAAALARDGDSNVYEERHWPAFAPAGEELNSDWHAGWYSVGSFLRRRPPACEALPAYLSCSPPRSAPLAGRARNRRRQPMSDLPAGERST
jgi:hypothetical protein